MPMRLGSESVEEGSQTRITNTILGVRWTTPFIWQVACCKLISAQQLEARLSFPKFSPLVLQVPHQTFTVTDLNRAYRGITIIASSSKTQQSHSSVTAGSEWLTLKCDRSAAVGRLGHGRPAHVRYFTEQEQIPWRIRNDAFVWQLPISHLTALVLPFSTAAARGMACSPKLSNCSTLDYVG